MKKTIVTVIIFFAGCCAIAQSANSYLPVVFVHDMLGSGDTYAQPIQHFIEQGYNPSLLVALDWNTVSFSDNKPALQLDSVINKVLQKTGATQVNLVGHSAGGGLCYGYLKDSSNAAKVAHYIHIGSGRLSKPAMVPTMNVYSKDDLVSGGADVDGATNISLLGKDHYEVATCNQTFESMFRFFNNSTPVPSQINKLPIMVGGRSVTFGENKPEANAGISVYNIDNKTGKRTTAMPVYTTTTDSLGYWSGFVARAGEYYEIQVVSSDSSKRPIHYYREPFAFTNPMVYLRTLGNQGITAMLSNALPKSNTQCALAVFSSAKAVITGRDSLSVNGLALSSTLLSPAEKTCIAYFLFDDGDAATSGKKLPLFGRMPFMNVVDMMITPNSKPVALYYNGRTMKLPSLSSSEAIMVAVFD